MPVQVKGSSPLQDETKKTLDELSFSWKADEALLRNEILDLKTAMKMAEDVKQESMKKHAEEMAKLHEEKVCLTQEKQSLQRLLDETKKDIDAQCSSWKTDEDRLRQEISNLKAANTYLAMGKERIIIECDQKMANGGFVRH